MNGKIIQRYILTESINISWDKMEPLTKPQFININDVWFQSTKVITISTSVPI